MRTKPQLEHETSGFGVKGVGEKAQSLAESLLSGKPLGKPQVRKVPKLKPRPKPQFGRQDLSEKFVCAVERKARRTVRRGGRKGTRRGWRFWSVTLVAFVLGLQALAGIFDWPSPTLGGRQLWTDVRVQDGWRVQCHAWTGHCRLLDDNDIRRTWGEQAQVLAAMQANLPTAPNTPHTVVLVHGLGRSAHSFDDMADALTARGLNVVRFNYASTQGPIAQHGAALNRVVGALDTDRVSFVTHSLGAIVVRQALALNPTWTGRMQLGASVLLAGPNQGSAVARTLSEFTLANAVFGPVLRELADGEAIKNLPVPTPFATVSGTNNPLWFFSEKSDGLVSVDEAQLDGQAEHLSVPAAHTFIMDDPKVVEFTVAFVGGGE